MIEQLFAKANQHSITNLIFRRFVNGCRSLRELRSSIGFDPGVCSLRSLHPRLYADTRFAGWGVNYVLPTKLALFSYFLSLKNILR